MLPDLRDLLLVACPIIIMTGMAAHVVFGHRVASVASETSTLYMVFKYVLLADDNGLYKVGGCMWAVQPYSYAVQVRAPGVRHGSSPQAHLVRSHMLHHSSHCVTLWI